jgi:hypothetical protein
MQNQQVNGKTPKLIGIVAKAEPLKKELGLEVNFYIAEGSFADPMFFTSPAIRKAIAEGEILSKTSPIGHIRYKLLEHLPNHNAVYTENFNPTGTKTSYENGVFRKAGAGINLHRIAMRELLKFEGGRETILAPSANHASVELLAYLTKLKIISPAHEGHQYRYSAKDAVRKINTHIKAWRKSNRPKVADISRQRTFRVKRIKPKNAKKTLLRKR